MPVGPRTLRARPTRQTSLNLPEDPLAPPPEVHIRRLFVRYGARTRRTSYVGPCSVASLRAHCVDVYALGTLLAFADTLGPDLVLSLCHPKRPDLFYLLEDAAEVGENSLLLLHPAGSAKLTSTQIQSRLVAITDRVDEAVQDLGGSVQGDDLLDTLSEAPAERRRSIQSVSATSLQRQLSSAGRRQHAALLLAEVRSVRYEWEGLRVTAQDVLMELQGLFIAAIEGIMEVCREHSSHVSDISHKRLAMQSMQADYQSTRRALEARLDRLGLLIAEAARETLVIRTQPLGQAMQHGTQLLEECRLRGNELQQRFEAMEDVMRMVWKAEVSNAIQEEDFYKSELLRQRETQETKEDCVQVFAHLSRVVSVQSQIPRVRPRYPKEDLAEREKTFTALLLEVEHVGSRDPELRASRVAEMDQWREKIRELRREDAEMAVFARQLSEKRSHLRSVPSSPADKGTNDEHTPTDTAILGFAEGLAVAADALVPTDQ